MAEQVDLAEWKALAQEARGAPVGRYLASLSPERVLALLDRVEAAERERDALRTAGRNVFLAVGPGRASAMAALRDSLGLSREEHPVVGEPALRGGA